jgi:S1-C subfamily serine protease
MATIIRVAPSSLADRAGLQQGDDLISLAGQPLLSVADLQWVLHNTPATAQLAAQVRRDGKTLTKTLDLPAGWRDGNISWRTTTWELRRMVLGGMKMSDLDDTQRREAKLPVDTMALRVQYIGQFGAHALAKKAGLQQGDLLIAFDGRTDRMSESQVIAHLLRRRKVGDVVSITVVRNGEQRVTTFAQQ